MEYAKNGRRPEIVSFDDGRTDSIMSTTVVVNHPFVTTFEQHLEEKYGKRGTPTRDEYESGAHAFMIAEMLKEERRLAKLTQEELAQKTGTKKSLIARFERGQIELSTAMLNVLFETGFGKQFQEIGYELKSKVTEV